MDDETKVTVDGEEVIEQDEPEVDTDTDVDEFEDDIDSDDEATDDESEEEEGSGEQEEADEEGDEADFDEWLAQYGNFPDGIKTEDDLAKAYAESLVEMKRKQSSSQKLEQLDQMLRQQGYTDGVQSLMSGEKPQRQELGGESMTLPDVKKSYFSTNPVTDYIKKLAESGQIDGEGLSSAKATATTIDSAIGPEFKKFEQVYTVMANNLVNLTKKVRDLMWDNIPKDLKGKVQRNNVDQLLERGLFEDYESAIKYALFNNPESLREFADKAEKAGEKRAKKKLRKNRSLRRSKSAETNRSAKYDYHKYLDADGNWDNAKLNRLPNDKQIAMIEAFAKENKIDL